MPNFKKDADYIEMTRADLSAELVRAGTMAALARRLRTNEDTLAAFCRSTARRTRQGRVDEALSLVGAGLSGSAAAAFSCCGTGALQEARATARQMAPPLSVADRIADHVHLARWGHV